MSNYHFDHGPDNFGHGGFPPRGFGPGGFGPGGFGHREYDDFGHWASGANSNGPWGHWRYHEGLKKTSPKKIKSGVKILIITIIVIFAIGLLFEALSFIGGLKLILSM